MNKITVEKFKEIHGWDEFYNEKKLSDKRKKKLLEMASRGEDRPKIKKHPLGGCLYHYTNPNQGAYDPEFDKDIRQRRPDWFTNQNAVSKENKKALLTMADRNEKRPVQKRHKLGRCLSHYTDAKSKCYDPEFDKDIRQRRPDWFIAHQEKKVRNVKEDIIKLALNNSPRPHRNSYLGSRLCNYLCKNGRGYDVDLSKKLRTLRTDWFSKTTEYKKKLLKMAVNGESKISDDDINLRAAFYRYTNRNNSAYDPEFDKDIRQRRPDWFKCDYE